MVAKAKYSKKLFENLDRAEVRKLAIVGMKLAPAKAYTMDFKTLVSWVYDRATEVPDEEINGDRDRDPRPFAEVDLDAVGNEAFRDGVMHYIEKLQELVRGTVAEAPAWPPASTTPEKKVEAVIEPAAPKAVVTKAVVTKAVVEALEEAPAKRKRGRPRKNPVAEATQEPTQEPAQEPKKEAAKIVTPAAKPKTKIKKASLGTKANSGKSSTTDTVATQASTDDMAKTIGELMVTVEELSTNIANISAFTDGLANGIKNGFEQISEQVAAVRTEQTAANNLLGNALLFLMNSVVFEEGEEKADLSGVPEPSAYLDIEE